MKACPYCAEQIQDAAIVCKHCRRELSATYIPTGDAARPLVEGRKRSLGERIGIGVGVFFAALLGVPLVLMILYTFVFNPPARPQSASAQSGAGLTYANYQRLREGMTYPETTAILGSSGQEISRSDLAGYTTVMYSWEKRGGANVNVMFQNGRLVTKAQFGLN